MDSADIVRMANQIADFFAVQTHDEAVAGIAAHIRNFWEPRMRRALYELVENGGAHLHPLVREAAEALRAADRARSH
jgi:formate dehydrogenase subunit delta